MKKKTKTKKTKAELETPEQPVQPEPEQPVVDDAPDSSGARVVEIDLPSQEEPGLPSEQSEEETALCAIVEPISLTDEPALSDESDESGVSDEADGFIAEEGYGDTEEEESAESAAPATVAQVSEVADSPAQVAQVDEFVFQAPNASEEEPESLPLEIEEETAEVEEIGEGALFQTLADMKAAIECVFFTTSHPLTLVRLRNILGKVDIKTLRGAVSQLQAEYEARCSGLQILESSEGFQMCTRPQYADAVLRLHKQRKKNPLSMTALETLAIIAYKQPITRAEIEMIRGVESSGVVRNLLDMGLVRVVGRKEVIGRPQLYGTTNVFLAMFGLKSNQDLPPINELRRRYASSTLLHPSAVEQLAEPESPSVDSEPSDGLETASDSETTADAEAITDFGASSETEDTGTGSDEDDAPDSTEAVSPTPDQVPSSDESASPETDSPAEADETNDSLGEELDSLPDAHPVADDEASDDSESHANRES